jgi:hypothetical protein
LELLEEFDHIAHTDKYDFKSENVIELLKQLQAKFEDEKLATIKAETNRQNAYKLAKLARDNAISAAQGAAAKKTTERKRVEKLIADAEKEKEDEETDLEVDSKALKDIKAQCAMKKGEWEQRSSTRDGEIKAMDAAISILAEASGVRTKPPSNPVPPPSPDSDLNSPYESSVGKEKAFTFLQELSLKSPTMSAVAVLLKESKCLLLPN